MNALPFSFFSLLGVVLGITFLFSCSEEPARVFIEPDCPEAEVVYVSTTSGETGKAGYRFDFSIVSGIHPSGESILNSLLEKKTLPSKWTIESLKNEDLLLSGERKTYNIVVLSIREMGFLEDELVLIETILKRAQEMDLELLTFEDAMSIREQFLAQPDYSTGHRLGEFFIGMSPIRLSGDGKPKLASIIRDDNFPHSETGIGLWVVMNDVTQDNGQPRLFNPLDPEGRDLGGYFAFGVPDDLNLDLIEEMERLAREEAGR